MNTEKTYYGLTKPFPEGKNLFYLTIISRKLLTRLNNGFIVRFFVVAVLSVPVIAYASGILNSNTSSLPATPTQNSQTMTLLQSNGPGDLTPPSSASIVAGVALATGNDNGVDPSATVTGSDQISLYIVHAGDTLGGIAQMFGVSVNTIVWANNLTNKKVSPGQELVILPITGVEYTVKKGDTLASIAKKFKSDATEISQFNNIADNSALVTGDTIIIPDGEMTTTFGSSSSSSSGTTHIRPGGTSPLASGALPAPSDSPAVGSHGPNYPVIVGYYERPIIGGIKTQGIHGHNGVDLSSSYGTSILASADGTVIVAKSGGWNGGYGSYIVISHPNGTQTLYAHLSSVGVGVGDQVNQGQTIGKMGQSGEATGVHVHFEIRGAQNPF